MDKITSESHAYTRKITKVVEHIFAPPLLRYFSRWLYFHVSVLQKTEETRMTVWTWGKHSSVFCLTPWLGFRQMTNSWLAWGGGGSILTYGCDNWFLVSKIWFSLIAIWSWALLPWTGRCSASRHMAGGPCCCGSVFFQIRKSATSSVTETIAENSCSNPALHQNNWFQFLMILSTNCSCANSFQ